MKKQLITIIFMLGLVAVAASPAEASTIESAVKNLDSSLNQLIAAEFLRTECAKLPEYRP